MNCKKSTLARDTAIWTFLYFATMPYNSNRPHWFAIYQQTCVSWFGFNIISICFSAHYESSLPWIFTNIIIISIFIYGLMLWLKDDAIAINIERDKLRIKCNRLKVAYEDPYPPNYPRRVCIILSLIIATVILQLLANDFYSPFSLVLLISCCLLIISVVIAYLIRDHVCADKIKE